MLRTGEELPAAPQQARSLAKHKKLLDAGRILFGRKGYEATSIEEITAQAKTAAGAFYQHFRSKRQLLVVLMNEFLEQLGSLDLRPAAGADVRTGLRDFLIAAFRADAKYYGVVRAWQEAALSDAAFRRMERRIATWTENRILRVFQALQQHPNARPQPDLPVFARMMDRHFWSLLARGSRMRAGELDREVEIAAGVIYHYLFRDEPGAPTPPTPAK